MSETDASRIRIDDITVMLQIVNTFTEDSRGVNLQWNSTLLKNVGSCRNSNIYSYLVTYGGQSYHVYINVVHF
jgi:hypothetical protein